MRRDIILDFKVFESEVVAMFYFFIEPRCAVLFLGILFLESQAS